MPDLKIPGTRYLVGGAVRDELLGVTPRERDWVIVGADPEIMIEAGFIPVGKAYPVFLHPKTFEEHALARTETKTGPGHGGFSFKNDADVTLEQDLLRRDLTINAMAKSASGELIDPYGGQNDLHAKKLKHVSTAFAEDPLRCFRVARFAAKLPRFEITTATLDLIRSMGDQLNELSAERVWNEWVKALEEIAPFRFYEVLRDAQITAPWFSELALDELVVGHRDRVLPLQGAFALIGWLHSEQQLSSLFDRLMAPKKAKSLALEICLSGRLFEQFDQLDDERAIDLLDQAGAFHGDARFETFLTALTNVADVDKKQFLKLRKSLRKVTTTGEQGPKYGQTLRQNRIKQLNAIRGGEGTL